MAILAVVGLAIGYITFYFGVANIKLTQEVARQVNELRDAKQALQEARDFYSKVDSKIDTKFNDLLTALGREDLIDDKKAKPSKS